MRLSPLTVLLVAALPAQSAVYAPANANTTPANARNNYPFQRIAARVQNFVDGTELSNSAPFVVNRLSFRWDETTTSGTNQLTFGTFNIDLGATTRDYTTLSASFADNRVGSTVAGSFTATNYSFALSGSPPNTAWGGADGKLTFPLPNPVPVVVPAGGCFFVDITATARTGTAGNALIDFQQDSTALVAGPVAGTVGAGCASGNGTASLIPNGQFVAGTSVSMSGTGYAPSLPYVRIISTGPQTPALPLPGAPTCFLNVSLSPSLLLSGVTPATGAWTAFDAGTYLPLPLSLGAGSQLYFQDVGVTATSTLYSSQGRFITLGTRVAPTLAKGWFVGHHFDAASDSGSFCAWGIYAMQLD